MDYYRRSLGGERLRRCYTLAPPRVRRYLAAEAGFVLDRVVPGARVLELGCGYGRVLAEVLPRARRVAGIDTSVESLALARTLLEPARCDLACADAATLGLAGDAFDLVFCVQNGISAFRVDPSRVVAEALRVARPGGTVVLSSYAARFWPHRLEWFRIQAAHGLVGEIDEQATGDGVIACLDGFRSGTFAPEDFRALLEPFGIAARIEEVDGSSVCCAFAVP